MKISELIAELIELKDKHGDLLIKVAIFNNDSPIHRASYDVQTRRIYSVYEEDHIEILGWI